MAYSPLSANRFNLVFAAWWLSWSAVHAFVLSDYNFSPLIVATDSVVSNLLLAGSCLLISNNMKYYLPRQEKYWYVLIVSIVFCIIWLSLSRWILVLIFKNNTDYILFLQQSIPIRAANGFLQLGCMAMMSLLWYTLHEQKETIDRKNAAEKLAIDAELFNLRQQLQPHFLFNSLNSISALTGVYPEKARHMIQQLSDFLRGTLKKDDQQWNSLMEELAHLELYLEIEKVRFGHRLQTQTNIEPGTENLRLPALLLQPVVENAIKFGLYDTLDEVVITIRSEYLNGQLVLSVQNPFDAETAQSSTGTGFGLSSIQRRLYLLFARHDLVKTEIKDNIFITNIIIPQ